jgi:hypothetical protein
MLLDTGADASLIPQWCVDHLGIPVEGDQVYSLIGYDGTQADSSAVTAQLSFQSLRFKGKFLVRRDPVGVIGRNMLNCLSVKLNGRELSWELE